MFWKGKDKKNKSSLVILAIFIVALVFVFNVNFVLAQTATSNLATFGASAGLSNTPLPTLIGNIVRIFLGLLGVLAVLIILYGGWTWMISNGDTQKVDKAKKILIAGVIGLIIIMASFAIASFIMKALGLGGGGNIPGQPCTAGQQNLRNCGVQRCINGVWGDWENTCSPASHQSTYINKFSDNGSDLSRPWSIRVNWNDNRTIGVPQSTSTLQVGGYAKNVGGTISKMELLWTTSTAPVNPWPLLGQFQDAPTNVPEINNASYLWDTSGLATGTTSTLKIQATLGGLGTLIDSNPIKTIIRARHCFNNIQDIGETGKDCGGECGSCPGESCNNNLSGGTCSPDNAQCSNGVCDNNTCTCAWPPHIDSISPTTNVGTTELPNGAVGNYITILGRGFGTSSALGSVNFWESGNAQSSTQAFPPGSPCPVVWDDNQIIVEVPNVVSDISNNTNDSEVVRDSSTNYKVMVSHNSLNSDNQVGFQINNIQRPGICNAVPRNGVAPSSTNIIGNKFLRSSPSTSSVIWDLGAFKNAKWVNGQMSDDATWVSTTVTSTASNWISSTTVTDVIPDSSVAGNMADIRIYDGENYSNKFRFTLSDGSDGSFCGGYSRTCDVANSVCSSTLGLICNPSSCTCQKGSTDKTCEPGTVSTTAVCDPVGTCGYERKCNATGDDWNACAPRSGDPGCAPNPFTAQATQTLYAWGFKVTTWGGGNQSCGYDVWGVCDPRGCNSGLTCNIEGSTDQWVELYNGSSASIDLSNYGLVSSNTPAKTDNLVMHYAFDNNSLANSAPNAPASSSLVITQANNPDFKADGKFGFCLQFKPDLNTPAKSFVPAYVKGDVAGVVTSTDYSFTFSTWFFPTTSTAGREYSLISRGSGYIIGLVYRPDERFSFMVFGKNDPYQKQAVISRERYLYSDSANHRWFHLAGVYDETTSPHTIKIYVDGELAGTLPLPVNYLINNQHGLNFALGGIIGDNILCPTDGSWCDPFWRLDGKLDDVRIFNKALTEAEISSLYNTKFLSGTIASQDYKIIDQKVLGNSFLPLQNGKIKLVKDDFSAVDTITYASGVVPPASIGRKADGSVVTFNKTTLGTSNDSGAISGNNLRINELSFLYPACTCVAPPTCTTEGEEKSCSDEGNCPSKQYCRSGRWTECQVVSDACYTPATQATQAIFSWAFTMQANLPGDAPHVIEDCNRDPSCDPNDRLPSPSPWYLPSSTPSASEGWSNISHPGVLNPWACANAIISVRFSQYMLPSSFTTSTATGSVRVYRGTTSTQDWQSSWTDNGSAGTFPADAKMISKEGNAIKELTDFNESRPDNYVTYHVTTTVDGEYKLSLKTSNTVSTCGTGDISNCVNSNIPNFGQFAPDQCYRGDDGNKKVYHDIDIYVDNLTNKVGSISAQAVMPDNKATSTSGSFNIQAGAHDLILKWVNDCGYKDATTQNMIWDSNLVIYNMELDQNAGSVSTWQTTTISSLVPEDCVSVDGGCKQLKIGVGDLESSTVYKVILTDSIKSNGGQWLKRGYPNYFPALVNRNCAVGAFTADSSTIAYCWNFQTRSDEDPNFKCKEGCPTCTPNPTRGGYYGDENQNNADLDSKDNVCLMLNPWDYNWNWSVSQPAGNREDITNNDDNKWDAVLGKFIPGTDSFKDPQQTSTAKGETIYDGLQTTTINSTLVVSGKSATCVVKNNFTDPYILEERVCNASTTPSPSPWKEATDVCLNAAVLGRFNLDMYDPSLMPGSLPTTTHPNIIIQKCTSATSSATSSPITGGECITQENWPVEIFSYSHPEVSMIDLEQDPNASNTPEGFFAYPPSGQKLVPNIWYRVIVLGNDSLVPAYNEGVHSASTTPGSSVELPQGIYNTDFTNFPDQIDPPDYYWYFKTGSSLCKIQYINVSPYNYYMPFVPLGEKYTAIPYNCNMDNSGISNNIGTVLNPNSFKWNWRSLFNLSDDAANLGNSLDSNYGGTSIKVADICNESATSTPCASYANPLINQVMVWGIAEGPIVNIKARALSSSPDGTETNGYNGQDVSSSGQLKVGTGNFSIDAHFPNDTSCSNPDVKLYFSDQASSTSMILQKNINLWKCDNPDCNRSASLSSVALRGLYPVSLNTFEYTNNPNPKFSNLMVATTSGLLAGKYRVTVQGGVGGVVSWAGDGLTDLNFKLSNNTAGEACESSTYPWNTLSGVCSATTCKLNDISLCGTRFEECTTSTIGTTYCDVNCHNKGNKNLASCGNGKVEPGEECDDGNIVNGDSCSSNCLFEGSNKNKYGSLCGNGGTCTKDSDCNKGKCINGLCLEKGEECDFGTSALNTSNKCDSNTCLWQRGVDHASNFGKGIGVCSSTSDNSDFCNIVTCGTNSDCLSGSCNTGKCLNGTNLLTGSQPSVPVCGNGKVEKGEQCDDGKVVSGDGCKGTESGVNGCLWEGSASPTCGNGVIENGQNNYYSWTFNVAQNPEICEPAKININPCPNGIWQISLENSISSSTVNIYKGAVSSSNPNASLCNTTTDSFTSFSFFQKIVRKVKIVLRDFLGIRFAIAENYWCRISNEQYDSVKLHSIDLGNYEATTTIDSTTPNNRIIAYPDPGDRRVINYTRSDDWATGTPYRVVVLYAQDDISGMVATTTQAIRTYSEPRDYDYKTTTSTCSIKNVDVNAWPKGEVKNVDAFFCKGENCGLDTPNDAYDDDVSAPWNPNYQITSTPSGFRDGNQHLYRAWAYTSAPKNYLVRANFSNFSLVSVPYNVGTARAEFSSSTFYNGGSWITGGVNQGRSQLYINANNGIRSGIGDNISSRASTTVDIRIMFCKNPWPGTRNPLFSDSADNCAYGGCVNTNFETWYCRDAGTMDVCVGGTNGGSACKTNADCSGGSCQLYTADDLPAIGSYNNASSSWKAAVSGLGTSTCPNLPNDFTPRVGYYDGASSTTYLWNASGVVYASSNTGWLLVSRGALAEKGLPPNFGPTVGYYDDTNKVVQLWDYDGNMYEYSHAVGANERWTKNTATISKGLPKGFRPYGGYYHPGAGGIISLWDAFGKGTHYPSGTSWALVDIVKDMSANKVVPAVAYYKTGIDAGIDAQMWDRSGKLYQNNPGWVAVDRPTVINGLPANFNPDVGYVEGNNIILWDGQKSYKSFDGINYSANNEFEKTCDRKVKDFLFISNNQFPVQFLLGSEAIFYTASTNKYKVQFSSTLGGLVQYGDWDAAIGSEVTFNLGTTTAGQYNLTLETSNDSNITYPLTGSGLGNCTTTDNKVYHNVEVYVDATTSESNLIDTITPIATNPDDPQTTRTASFDLTNGPHKIIMHWTNDCYAPPVDSNLTIYNLKLYSYNSDAIGIRVMTNNNHYSPYYWYSNTFNGASGVQGLSIDDYDAISVGRTVYANATDINTTTPTESIAGNIFGDIFLMSYSEGANANAVSICNQMVNNWRFNAGTKANGGLDESIGLCSGAIKYACKVNSDCDWKYNDQPALKQDLGTCVLISAKSSVCSNGFQPPCLSDSDCHSLGAGYCSSSKASLTRDTKRLSDIQDVNYLLNSFYNKKRCSNDQYRLCNDGHDCYGGGTCSNYYPNLSSGTYIPNRTFSVWPSWQDNLSKLLGFGLPVDPINRLFGCVSPFDSGTCWNVASSTMFSSIQSSSSVYFYSALMNGTGYGLFAHGEFDANGDKWRPTWESVNLMRYNPFGGYHPEAFNRADINCGDGYCNDGLQNPPANGVYSLIANNFAAQHKAVINGSPEDCKSCWIDCGCGFGSGLSCESTPTPAVFNLGADFKFSTCQDLNVCGDGIKGPHEECDCGTGDIRTCKGKQNGEGNSGCSASCQCTTGFACQGEDPQVVCGDGIFTPPETCEFKRGNPLVPTCGLPSCCELPGSDHQCQQVSFVTCGDGTATNCSDLTPSCLLLGQTPDGNCSKTTGVCQGKCIGGDPPIQRDCTEGAENPGQGRCANLTNTCEIIYAPASRSGNSGLYDFYTEVACDSVRSETARTCQETCQPMTCGNGKVEGLDRPDTMARFGEKCDCGSTWGSITLQNQNELSMMAKPCVTYNGNGTPPSTPNALYDNSKKGQKYSSCNSTCSGFTDNIAYRYCGDSNRDGDGGEECDDGNAVDNDHCSNSCKIVDHWIGKCGTYTDNSCVNNTNPCGDNAHIKPSTPDCSQNPPSCDVQCEDNGIHPLPDHFCGDGQTDTPNSAGVYEECDGGAMCTGDCKKLTVESCSVSTNCTNHREICSSDGVTSVYCYSEGGSCKKKCPVKHYGCTGPSNTCVENTSGLYITNTCDNKCAAGSCGDGILQSDAPNNEKCDCGTDSTNWLTGGNPFVCLLINTDSPYKYDDAKGFAGDTFNYCKPISCTKNSQAYSFCGDNVTNTPQEICDKGVNGDSNCYGHAGSDGSGANKCTLKNCPNLKTCATDYQNICDTGLDDGCGGTLTCVSDNGCTDPTPTCTAGVCGGGGGGTVDCTKIANKPTWQKTNPGSCGATDCSVNDGYTCTGGNVFCGTCDASGSLPVGNRNDTKDVAKTCTPSGVCCRGNGDTWATNSACPVLVGDTVALQLDGHGVVTPDSSINWCKDINPGNKDKSLCAKDGRTQTDVYDQFTIGHVVGSSNDGDTVGTNGKTFILSCGGRGVNMKINKDGSATQGHWILNCDNEGSEAEFGIFNKNGSVARNDQIFYINNLFYLKVREKGANKWYAITPTDDPRPLILDSDESKVGKYGWHFTWTASSAKSNQSATKSIASQQSQPRVAGASEQKQLNVIDKVEIAIGTWINNLFTSIGKLFGKS